MSDFAALGIKPGLVGALSRSGISQPTPIQTRAIPLALEGRDVMGLAQTGTGKTLAFGLPMVTQLLEEAVKPAPKTVRSLILAPTRELVGQISDSLRKLVTPKQLGVAVVVGGQSINRQCATLARGVDILVATPGRLIDLLDRGAVKLGSARFLVLDEADQMLDLGFIHALRKIAPHLGEPRQTMLFSATMPKHMTEVSKAYLTDPVRVEVSAPGKTADKISQTVEFLDKSAKQARLREVLDAHSEELTLVFGRTKYGAEKLCKKLVSEGYAAVSVHGNKTQGQRERALKAFRKGEARVMVATDVAARGIDIPGVGCVVNFDLPNVPESYVHRIGRTARAGREGVAVSFCAPDERAYLRDIEKLIGLRFGEDGTGQPAPKGCAAKGKAGQDAAPNPKGKPRRRRRPASGAGNGAGGGRPKRRSSGGGNGGGAQRSRAG